MLYVLIGHKALQQLRNHLALHHLLGFKWHSGHGYKHFPRFLKPHYRSRSHFILNHSTRRRHHGLRRRKFIDFQMPFIEHFEHIALHLLVVDKLSTEISAKRRLGDIIFCRSKSAGGQHNISLRKSFIDGFKNLITIITYHFHAFYIPPERIQMSSYPT